jgi:hypothetical protein
MAEAAFRSVQIGKETDLGTEVAATLVMPMDTASGELVLVRGTNTPDEDYGRGIRNHSARGSHGVRLVTGSVSAVATWQTLPHFLQMGLAAASTTGSGAPFTHLFTADATTQTIESYTWEVYDDTEDFIGVGIVIPSFELGFDAVAAGENSPWMFSGDLQGVDLNTGTATASLTAPVCETMEGHLSTIALGDTSTAFASLTELEAQLISFSISVAAEKPPRPYAGTDTFTSIGHRKRVGTVTAIFQLHADTMAQTFDLYNVAGAVPTYGRMRVTCAGSGDNEMTLDAQLLITDAHVEDGRDGERTISMTAETVDDATLETDIEISITNAVASY